MLSIIIPSYKGALSLQQELPELILFLKTNHIENEIIVVNDGSQDKGFTEKVCAENACICLSGKKNYGKGAAVKKGVFAAKGDQVVFTDADIPFSYEAFKAIPGLLKKYHLVIGDRTLSDSVYFSEINFLRRIGSRVFSFFVQKFITPGFPDTQCGFKAFRAEIAKELFFSLQIKRYAFDVEIIHQSIKKNLLIGRIPVQLRQAGGSGIHILANFFSMIMDVISIKYKK